MYGRQQVRKLLGQIGIVYDFNCRGVFFTKDDLLILNSFDPRQSLLTFAKFPQGVVLVRTKPNPRCLV